MVIFVKGCLPLLSSSVLFVLVSCLELHLELGAKFHASKTGPSSVSTHRSRVVPVLQFSFVYASMMSYVAFVLLLFVPHLSFF